MQSHFSSSLVWADDSWLQQHAGETIKDTEEEEGGEGGEEKGVKRSAEDTEEVICVRCVCVCAWVRDYVTIHVHMYISICFVYQNMIRLHKQLSLVCVTTIPQSIMFRNRKNKHPFRSLLPGHYHY